MVGFPNAGKSTLISRISAARPKIADYPFTTLVPNLGMVRTGLDHHFVVADIPGLIEGASEGLGLGHRFLRHVERVAVLAFILSITYEEGRSPESDYAVLLRELEAYSPDMLGKPRVLILAKTDLPDTAAHLDAVRALAEAEGAPFFAVSAVRGDGLQELLYALQGIVDRSRADRASAQPEDEPESQYEDAQSLESDEPLDGAEDELG